MEAVALVVPIVFTITLALLIGVWRKFQNQERLAMIEKGMVLPQKQATRVDPAGILTAGFLFVGAGIGLVFAQFASSNFPEDEAVALYFGLILIFGGLGLLASYYIQYKMDEKSKKHLQEN